jgi:hypothetical protein
MKNPFAELRFPLSRSLPITRAVVYSALVLVLLSYLSFRWIYSHPRQVEIRLEAQLSRAVTSGVRVQRATYEYGRGTRAEQIEIDAPRTSTSGRLLTRLRQVHLDTAIVNCGDAVGGSTTARTPGSTRGRRRVVVCKASLHLEHDVSATDVDTPVDWTQGWNVDGLFRDGLLGEVLATERFDIEVRQLDLDWRLLRPAGGKWSRAIHAQDVLLSTSSNGLSLSAALSSSAWWDAGRIDVEWLPGSRWLVRGELVNLRSGKEWLPFLPDRHARLWRAIDPRGASTLELRELSRVLRTGAADDEPAFVLDLLWRHYDTTMRLPGVNVGMRAISGIWHVTGEQIAWGDDAGQPPSMGEVWAQRCRLSGRLGTDGEGQLNLQISTGDLSTLREATTSPALADLLRSARTSDTISGSWTIFLGKAKSALWTAKLTLTNISFAGFGALRCEEVRVVDLTARRPSDADGTGEGTGRLAISHLDWDGIGRFGGDVVVIWDEKAMRLVLDDVTRESIPGSSSATDAEREPGTATGSVSGSLVRPQDGSGWRVDLSWKDIPLATKVLRADPTSGDFHAPAKRPTKDPSASGTGTFHLGPGTVPARIVGETPWDFDRGACEWELVEGAVRIRRLELVAATTDTEAERNGEGNGNADRNDSDDGNGTGGGALRVAGTIGFDGSVDLVCVRVEEAGRERLTALAPGASPREWLGPVETAAAEGLRAYRISGMLSAPDSRKIRRSDPAFSRAGRTTKNPDERR